MCAFVTVITSNWSLTCFLPSNSETKYSALCCTVATIQYIHCHLEGSSSNLIFQIWSNTKDFLCFIFCIVKKPGSSSNNDHSDVYALLQLLSITANNWSLFTPRLLEEYMSRPNYPYPLLSNIIHFHMARNKPFRDNIPLW